jgi:4-alpha-glucanotransferase
LPPQISLSLVLHNHQPVGNFGWVIEEVFGQAYEPMVSALERHPAIRLGLHYTGPLLEWLDDNRPEFIERLAALVARGQVEILGGAHFEPVLAALPRRDRHGQLARMRDDVERRFGARPAGAWLAERVWEPSLAYDLAHAGYRYTVLDDNHLRGAAKQVSTQRPPPQQCS